MIRLKVYCNIHPKSKIPSIVRVINNNNFYYSNFFDDKQYIFTFLTPKAAESCDIFLHLCTFKTPIINNF